MYKICNPGQKYDKTIKLSNLNGEMHKKGDEKMLKLKECTKWKKFQKSAWQNGEKVVE